MNKFRSVDFASMNTKSSSYTYLDILTLKPSESELVKAVPRPKGANIKNGLPTWKVIPLDSKLPLLPGPDGPISFSRGKLGTNLWKSSRPKCTDFILYDPHSYEVSFDYEPLHDKHLKHWLKNSKNVEHLLKLGLITEGMDVKCSVKQCNEYRKYLKRIHNNAIDREAVRREDHRKESMEFIRANEMLQHEMIRLNKKNNQKYKRNKNLEKLECAAELKKQECNRRLKRIFERTAYIEHMKKNEMTKSIERRRDKNEHIQNKIKAANKIERNRKIETLRRWHDSDLQKKRKHDQKCIQKKREKAEKNKEKWANKVNNQLKDIEKVEFLREQRKVQLEASRKFRMKKINSRQANLQEKILLKQGQPIVDHVTTNFKRKQTVILDTIRNKWYSEIKERYSQDYNTMKILKDKIKNTLANVRCNLEPYMLVSEAKKRLAFDLHVPEPVTFVMNRCMEEAIMTSVAKQVEATMYKVSHKILSAIDQLKSSTEIKPKISLKRSTVLFMSSENVENIKENRVSFGKILAYKRDDEDLTNLKSTKHRRPTPVPSAEIITNVVLQDPEIDLSSEDLFTHRKQLVDSVASVSSWLLKNVKRRVHALAVPSKVFKVSTRTPSALHPLVRICNLIMYSSKEDCTDILDTIILDVFKTIGFHPSYIKHLRTNIRN